MKMNEAGAAWLRDQRACAPDYSWAVESCASLREVVETAPPGMMRWTVVRLLDRRGRAEWAWRAASRVRHLMQDVRSTAALDTLRRWIDGQATDKELRAAGAAATAAYSAAASAAYAATAAAAADAYYAAAADGEGGDATAVAATHFYATSAFAAADAAAAWAAAAEASATAMEAEVEAQRRDALELIAEWPDEART